MSARRILVLYRYHVPPEKMRVAIRDHLQALEVSEEGHEIHYHNLVGEPPRALRNLRPDAVVLHTLLLCARWDPDFYVWKSCLDWLRELDCPKVAMPQDEYDCSEILDEWMAELGVDVILSNFGESVRELIYPVMAGRCAFGTVLTGYLSAALADGWARALPPITTRPIDIAYRASKLPYWFGSHGQLKHRIGPIVAKHAAALGLKTDISTSPGDTIEGHAWLDFLASSRTVIGCETGSSALNRRGEVKARIQHLLDGHEGPEPTFEEIDAQMPAGWDDHRLLSIGPRHLEAILTRTCQVLIEGHYEGILTAGRHYLAIRPDLSNLDHVLATLRDHDRLQRIADRAYDEVYRQGTYTYHHLARQIEAAIEGFVGESR